MIILGLAARLSPVQIKISKNKPVRICFGPQEGRARVRSESSVAVVAVELARIRRICDKDIKKSREAVRSNVVRSKQEKQVLREVEIGSSTVQSPSPVAIVVPERDEIRAE